MPDSPEATSVEWIHANEPVDYEAAVAWMDARAQAVRDGVERESVWLLEHPSLYTAGTSARSDELVDAGGLPVFRTGRGGRYTYHGPGQRVAYLVLDLNRRGRDVRRFVRCAEEWVIRALADLGVTGERREGRVGIWVETESGEAKVAALGLRLRRWVSTHGVSINVNPDMDMFRGIIPCGVREHGVTSLKALGAVSEMAALDVALRRRFWETLGRDDEATPDNLEKWTRSEPQAAVKPCLGIDA